MVQLPSKHLTLLNDKDNMCEKKWTKLYCPLWSVLIQVCQWCLKSAELIFSFLCLCRSADYGHTFVNETYKFPDSAVVEWYYISPFSEYVSWL